jgi:hypothetical protein
MGDQTGSPRFQALFESALQAYEKNTGVTLAEHSLALQLQNCHDIQSITILLQDQARLFGDFRANDRIMKLIESTVSILGTLSATVALGETVGLVRRKTLIDKFTSHNFRRRSHLRTQYRLALLSYSL